MAETLDGTLAEIFNGTCEATRAALAEWITTSGHGGGHELRCIVAELAYIAWKLSEIERKTTKQ